MEARNVRCEWPARDWPARDWPARYWPDRYWPDCYWPDCYWPERHCLSTIKREPRRNVKKDQAQLITTNSRFLNPVRK